MAKIAVIGSGGFGISLAVMTAKNGHDVTLYSSFKDEIDLLLKERENKKLLPGIKIPEEILLTNEENDLKNKDLLILAVPSFAVRSVAESIKDVVKENTVLASVAKGIDDESLERLSVILGKILPCKIVALTGPSHAEEVARGVATSIVAASEDRAAAEYVQEILMNPSFRIYVNDDIVGCELGGAFKNIIALAAGICHGLSAGDNALAALMTRGLTEIARLGVTLGAKENTFAGLSGMGDLIVTCTSVHSRNHRAGFLLGQGVSAEDAIAEVGTVEGYYATKSAYKLAKKIGVEVPIINELYAILFEGESASEAPMKLMSRPKKSENEEIWL